MTWVTLEVQCFNHIPGMAYDPAKHHRQSIRLRGFDYTSPGKYFVTICVKNRECLFGEIAGGVMRLNGLGEMAMECWTGIPAHFPGVALDAFVIMPNHVHGIIVVGNSGNKMIGETELDATAITTAGATHASPLPSSEPLPKQPNRPFPCGPTPHSIGAIVGSFKSATTKRINIERGTPGLRIWQRNYHDWIIRDADALIRIRNYITKNPHRWGWDLENPTFFL